MFELYIFKHVDVWAVNKVDELTLIFREYRKGLIDLSWMMGISHFNKNYFVKIHKDDQKI